jgi:hypothetical protein
MASRIRSCSTGRPPQPSDTAEPTAKPNSILRSHPTKSNPTHCTTRPRESNRAADLTANLTMAANPQESTRAANLAADLPLAARPRGRTWAADFAANLSVAVSPRESNRAANLTANLSTAPCPQESTRAANLKANLPMAARPWERTWAADLVADLSVAVCPPEGTFTADFSAESNLKTTFSTVVVAGRNVTPPRDAIAIPPPDQPFRSPNPFEMDDASNTSHGSLSASANNASQPLLTPNYNIPFNNDDVALKSYTLQKEEDITPRDDKVQPIQNPPPAAAPMLDKDATSSIQQAFDAHNCAFTMAIENVTAFTMDNPVPHTSPILANLMALMERSHKDVHGHLDDMNRRLNNVTEDHRTLLGSVNLTLTSLDSKANSTEITCLDQRIKTMTTNLATTIHEGMESNLSSLCTTVDKITNLKANLSHITKKIIPDAGQPIPALLRCSQRSMLVFLLSNNGFPLLPTTSPLTTLLAPSLRVTHPLIHQ